MIELLSCSPYMHIRCIFSETCSKSAFVFHLIFSVPAKPELLKKMSKTTQKTKKGSAKPPSWLAFAAIFVLWSRSCANLPDVCVQAQHLVHSVWAGLMFKMLLDCLFFICIAPYKWELCCKATAANSMTWIMYGTIPHYILGFYFVFHIFVTIWAIIMSSFLLLVVIADFLSISTGAYCLFIANCIKVIQKCLC